LIGNIALVKIVNILDLDYFYFEVYTASPQVAVEFVTMVKPFNIGPVYIVIGIYCNCLEA